METLSRLPGLLEEEHGLQAQNVGSDERFQRIDHAWMQHKTLGDFLGAVGHVNTLVMMAPLLFGRAFSGRRYTGQGFTACHQCLRCIAPIPALRRAKPIRAAANSRRGGRPCILRR